MNRSISGALALLALTLVACGDAAEESRPAGQDAAPAAPQFAIQDSADRVAILDGFSGPESVRYDPDQDVWFVGNFNGGGGERDANGFISRISAETGVIEDLRFVEGTPENPLHAPRGMFIVADTLWVADIDGVHAFHRRSGAQLGFVDLTSFDPGFLNDIAQADDGALYVTDTGRSAVYKIVGRTSTEALAGGELGNPNGITWDPAAGRLVIVPWEPGHRIHVWRPEEAPEAFGPSQTPGRLDGVEPFERRLLIASQSDSTVHFLDAGGSYVAIRTTGRPADIGVDTRRRRVAVPYIALDRVDIWDLPGN
jgi:DNA-binding beta-propeller fold protein YncE